MSNYIIPYFMMYEVNLPVLERPSYNFEGPTSITYVSFNIGVWITQCPQVQYVL